MHVIPVARKVDSLSWLLMLMVPTGASRKSLDTHPIHCADAAIYLTDVADCGRLRLGRDGASQRNGGADFSGFPRISAARRGAMMALAPRACREREVGCCDAFDPCSTVPRAH